MRLFLNIPGVRGVLFLGGIVERMKSDAVVGYAFLLRATIVVSEHFIVCG